MTSLRLMLMKAVVLCLMSVLVLSNTRVDAQCGTCNETANVGCTGKCFSFFSSGALIIQSCTASLCPTGVFPMSISLTGCTIDLFGVTCFAGACGGIYTDSFCSASFDCSNADYYKTETCINCVNTTCAGKCIQTFNSKTNLTSEACISTLPLCPYSGKYNIPFKRMFATCGNNCLVDLTQIKGSCLDNFLNSMNITNRTVFLDLSAYAVQTSPETGSSIHIIFTAITLILFMAL